MTAAEPAGRGLDAEAVKAEVKGKRFVELVEKLGGKPRKVGERGEWRCACFLHGGKKPNLALTPSEGVWYCHSSCASGGDAIELVQRAQGLDFKGALEWLADWAGFHGGGGAWKPEPRAWTPKPAPKPATTTADAAGAFLAALWATVEEAPWSPAVGRWLADVRGLEPDAAYGLGCRDWTTRRLELGDLVRSTPTEALEAVGFARGGYLHAAVRGCLDGLAAVAVPVWRLGCPFPERWRWRWVEAPARRAKSDNPFGGELPADLLGVGRPGRLEGAEVRLARLGSGEPGAGLVVLVEGEPDWWSATEALDGRAVVLAVCGSPKRWRPEWPSLHDLAALGVRRVAVCVHHGARADDGRGHGEHFAAAVAAGCARAGLGLPVGKLPAEGRDLNDMHRAGELAGWFSDVLEKVA